MDGCQITAIKGLITNCDHRIRKNQLCQVGPTKGAMLEGDQRIWKIGLRQARFIKGKTADGLEGARKNRRKKEIVLTESEFRDCGCTFFNNQLLAIESVVKAHDTSRTKQILAGKTKPERRSVHLYSISNKITSPSITSLSSAGWLSQNLEHGPNMKHLDHHPLTRMTPFLTCSEMPLFGTIRPFHQDFERKDQLF